MQMASLDVHYRRTSNRKKKNWAYSGIGYSGAVLYGDRNSPLSIFSPDRVENGQ